MIGLITDEWIILKRGKELELKEDYKYK